MKIFFNLICALTLGNGNAMWSTDPHKYVYVKHRERDYVKKH